MSGALFLRRGPVELDDFIRLLDQRRYTSRLEPGDRLTLTLFGVVVIQSAESWRVLPDEFAKEMRDAQRYLEGRRTSIDDCLVAFRACVRRPSKEAREALAEAWEAVPAHNRRGILSGADSRDEPIRRLVGGGAETEEVRSYRRDPAPGPHLGKRV